MWKHVLYIVLAYASDLGEVLTYASDLGEGQSIVCNKGEPVSFKCPCCPDELEQCKFKKLFKSGSIAEKGLIHNENYEFNDDKTHIALKKCNKDDEGTYIWRCGKCNVTERFHLQVNKIEKTTWTCYSGSKVSFACPCCDIGPECRFKKLNDGADIVRDSILTDPGRRYNYDDKSRVLLKECKEEDNGNKYEWFCEQCKSLSLFDLTVLTNITASVFHPSRHLSVSVLMINLIINYYYY